MYIEYLCNRVKYLLKKEKKKKILIYTYMIYNIIIYNNIKYIYFILFVCYILSYCFTLLCFLHIK